jgi:uncharacterized protein
VGVAAPARTCVGCRVRAPKGELLRLARTPEGIRPDAASRLRGRGTYLHRDPGCVERGLAGGGVARGLRTGLGPEELGRLRDDIEREMEQA